MPEKMAENIYKIVLPLPGNPLKSLNSYVITSAQKPLIIDTGFDLPECEAVMLKELRELDIAAGGADIFLTHGHTDHTGLAAKLGAGSKIYISAADAIFLNHAAAAPAWEASDRKCFEAGFSEEELSELRTSNPARVYAPKSDILPCLISDGGILSYGGYDLTCIATPGHMPGHMCLYSKQEKFMFLGDHVLFDITPNIISWDDTGDSLADYIESLEKIKKLEIKTPFPAHRTVSSNIYERIDGIITHHHKRLSETYDAAASKAGQTAYEIAGRMTWRIRCDSWDGFPLAQKWFAVGEALAHLDYLKNKGKINRVKDGGRFKYFAG